YFQQALVEGGRRLDPLHGVLQAGVEFGVVKLLVVVHVASCPALSDPVSSGSLSELRVLASASSRTRNLFRALNSRVITVLLLRSSMRAISSPLKPPMTCRSRGSLYSGSSEAIALCSSCTSTCWSGSSC